MKTQSFVVREIESSCEGKYFKLIMFDGLKGFDISHELWSLIEKITKHFTATRCHQRSYFVFTSTLPNHQPSLFTQFIVDKRSSHGETAFLRTQSHSSLKASSL
jgi:hypothetical protein